jgi:sialate O-acetylesterase
MKKHLPLVLSLFVATSWLSAEEVRLASVFTDHMVLQRGMPVPVWGWSDPGQEITVEFAGQKKTTRADASGKWRAKLDPLQANTQPDTLKVNTIAVEDVVVGDVWLCSGQSNMGFPVGSCLHPEQEIAEAKHPAIRLLRVAENPSLAPIEAVKGNWTPCSPETVASFSGVAYFFGRELHQRLQVPVGLLVSSVGGTPAEAWTRREAFTPEFAERADKEQAAILSQEEDNRRFVTERAAWEEKHGVKPPPVAEASRTWAEPDLDTTGWKPVTLPATWARLGAASGGVFWVRRDFEVPAENAGKPFVLGLNWITHQHDIAYLNGVEVGRAPEKAPGFNALQRNYRVPAGLLKAGRNVVAVRVVAASQNDALWLGRTVGVPVADPHAPQSDWLFQVERSFAPLNAEALGLRPKPNALRPNTVSSALYNGMITPLIPCALKGAVWYQGENNAQRSSEYRDLLSRMITDWRAQWGQGHFPFLIQQLVNNGLPTDDPNHPSHWPLLREAQTQVAQTVPGCHIAVGIELGDAHTVHPANKQEVGRRLALVALEKVYGEKTESSGPRYASMEIEGSTLRIRFTHAEGLHSRDGAPRQFAIAGEDGKFVWANATVDGDTVLASHPQVAAPVAVRYAWADNPAGCNLYNRSNLPAMPFRAETQNR